jgi:hypothetical protein
MVVHGSLGPPGVGDAAGVALAAGVGDVLAVCAKTARRVRMSAARAAHAALQRAEVGTVVLLMSFSRPGHD